MSFSLKYLLFREKEKLCHRFKKLNKVIKEKKGINGADIYHRNTRMKFEKNYIHV